MIFPALMIRKGYLCDTCVLRPVFVDLTDAVMLELSPVTLADWTGRIAWEKLLGFLSEGFSSAASTTADEHFEICSPPVLLPPLKMNDRKNEIMRSVFFIVRMFQIY